MIDLVFCIDDDPITLMLCEKILSKSNFCKTTIKAQNGMLGLEYFQSQSVIPAHLQQIPTLIILDLNMPVLDGWEFLQQFNEKYATIFPNVKVVVLSSSVNPNDKLVVDQYSQVIDFITKPLSANSVNYLKQHPQLITYFE
jgi:CheY-like chemotaxis protein